MATPSIKNLTVPQLVALRADIDKLLETKKAELTKQLAAIEGGTPKGFKVEPKYRDKNGNTWAGRGAQPKWLVEAIKSGRKLESFLIKK